MEHFHPGTGHFTVLRAGSIHIEGAAPDVSPIGDDAELEALRQLNEASSRLWRAASLREGLDHVLNAVVRLADTDRGAIELYDEKIRGFRVFAALGFGPIIQDYSHMPPSPPGSASRRAIEQAAPVFVSDTETEFQGDLQTLARAVGIRAVHAFPIIGKAGTCEGALLVHYRAPTLASPRIVERIKLYVRQVAEFIERSRVIEALAESERRERKRASEFEALVDAVPASIIIARDPELKTVMVSREAARVRGQSTEGSINQQVLTSDLRSLVGVYEGGQAIEPDDRPMHRATRGEEVRGFELEMRFGTAETRFIYGNAGPTRDDAGKVTGAMMAFVDITERRKTEEERKLLLAEINHRVKNTLATVIAIQQQTFARAVSPEDGQRAFERRIRALAQTHDRLAAENWSGVSLETLLEDELAPYRDEQANNITLRGSSLRLSPRSAVMLGLAFHELATNAVKHGALSQAGGTIDVSWQDAPGSPEATELIWLERGDKRLETPARQGFGRMLLERGIAAQLNCKVELAFPPTGAACSIVLPRSSLQDG